jgi:hypothetical protein
VQTVDLLAREMSETFHDMRTRLHGLSDEEFFREPVPRRLDRVRGEGGHWDHHHAEPDPVPAPFSTIAWRLTHLAMCKVMYHERGHALLTEDLAELADPDLERPVRTNWGEEWPAWRIFWTMIHHDAYHGGEIGALRDLFRERAAEGDPGAG